MTVLLRTGLRPIAPRVSSRELLRVWQRADFEPDACAAAARQLIADGTIGPELIDPDRVRAGGVIATDDLLFGSMHDARALPWRWSFEQPDRLRAFEVSADEVPAIAELIRQTSGAESVAEATAIARELVDDELAGLLATAFVHQADHGTWPAPSAPGIYRREHASLLVHSERGTVITDPQGAVNAWTTAGGAYPLDRIPPRARVLITHSHSDHWDLPSILRWVDSEEAVETPRVPAPSLLCLDMAGCLDVAEQARVDHAWFEWARHDDLEVQVLPFYGEQPTRALPLPGALRNWGNCYRFELEGFSLAILVDSGVDAAGSMVEAIRRSVDQRGPIDVLMSCCYEFPEAINLGLPDYVLTVPFDELRTRWHGKRASMTNGPDGVAAACEAAGARFFLPYAHGFSGLGQPPMSEEGSGGERAATDAVRQAIAARELATAVIDWVPGDVMRWRDGRPYIERVAG